MDYKKVIEDFNNGTIDRKKWKLTVDDDEPGGAWWSYIAGDIDVGQKCELQREMNHKYGHSEGCGDVVDILNAVGVNADWC